MHRKVILAVGLGALVVLALILYRAQSGGMVSASLDPHCSARIVARRSMLYRDGADASLDRPAHVRAASGIAWVGSRLAVVQDDAHFVALVDPRDGLASALPLPAGADGKRLFDSTRGTKHLKLDLETCFSVRDGDVTRLYAFGSGSKPLRERVLRLVLGHDGSVMQAPRIVDASSFYATLHARPDLLGGELNLEGALVRDDTLLLLQRGNGAAREGHASRNAVVELSWPTFFAYLETDGQGEPPPLRRVTPYDLGSAQGVPFTFTDATLLPSGKLLFVASAEDSSDSVSDGQVHGTRIGELVVSGLAREARMATLQDEDGTPSTVKAEGIVLDPNDASRAFLVVDMDDPALPSLLLEVALSFPD